MRLFWYGKSATKLILKISVRLLVGAGILGQVVGGSWHANLVTHCPRFLEHLLVTIP